MLPIIAALLIGQTLGQGQFGTQFDFGRFENGSPGAPGFDGQPGQPSINPEPGRRPNLARRPDLGGQRQGQNNFGSQGNFGGQIGQTGGFPGTAVAAACWVCLPNSPTCTQGSSNQGFRCHNSQFECETSTSCGGGIETDFPEDAASFRPPPSPRFGGAAGRQISTSTVYQCTDSLTCKATTTALVTTQFQHFESMVECERITSCKAEVTQTVIDFNTFQSCYVCDNSLRQCRQSHGHCQFSSRAECEARSTCGTHLIPPQPIPPSAFYHCFHGQCQPCGRFNRCQGGRYRNQHQCERHCGGFPGQQHITAFGGGHRARPRSRGSLFHPFN